MTSRAYLRQHKLPRDVFTLSNFRHLMHMLRLVFWTALSLSPLTLWELMHPGSPQALLHCLLQLQDQSGPKYWDHTFAKAPLSWTPAAGAASWCRQQNFPSISSSDGTSPAGGDSWSMRWSPRQQALLCVCTHKFFVVLIYRDPFDMNNHAWGSSVFQGNGKGTHEARIVTSKIHSMQ